MKTAFELPFFLPRRFYVILFFIMISITVSGQNTPPRVIIWKTAVNVSARTIKLDYQVMDAQNDPCRVWLRYSRNGGLFYDSVPASAITGDHGSGILPGARSLTWDFSSIPGNIYDTRLRLFASDGKPVNIQEMVNRVDSNRIRTNLRFIQGIRYLSSNPAQVNKVRDSIETIFRRYAFNIQKQSFSYGPQTGLNITGRKQGAGNEASTLIVDAHYDGVAGSPGADDNASGVAGMLEICRVLSGYEFENSLNFTGFDFEEAGLVGSQRYVSSGIPSNESVKGVLNLEMIGYYSNKANSQTLPAGFNLLLPDVYNAVAADSFRGNFIVVCGNTASSDLNAKFIQSAKTYVPDLKTLAVEVPGTGTIAPDLRRSDHASFWDAGYKALMMTDGSNFRNKNYHKSSDTLGTLNTRFMTRVTQATLATAAEMAKPISAGKADIDLVTLSDGSHDHGLTDNAWEIFPNPAGGHIEIRFHNGYNGQVRADLFDTGGRLVLSHLDLTSGGGRFRMPLDNISSGNYILLITTGEGSAARSLVVSQ